MIFHGGGRLFRIITVEDANKITIDNLRLDSGSLNLSSAEGIAGVLRKVACFKCPCPTRELNEFSDSLLKGLISNEEREKIPDIVESMISYGDLLEAPDRDSNAKKLLFGSQPAFVRANDSTVLFLGIVPDGFPPLPSILISKIEFANHIRRIKNVSENDINVIKKIGLQEFSMEYWQRSPLKETSEKFLKKINQALEKNNSSISKEGIKVISPEKNSSSNIIYYKQRWTELKSSMEGHFVARRERRFENPLWCYIKFKNNKITNTLNLPLDSINRRGCDEAWRIQMALDSSNKTPQLFGVEKIDQNKIVLNFFSPVPKWASRRWDVLGEPVSRNSLFSYCFEKDIVRKEIKYCKEMLWLDQLKEL